MGGGRCRSCWAVRGRGTHWGLVSQSVSGSRKSSEAWWGWGWRCGLRGNRAAGAGEVGLDQERNSPCPPVHSSLRPFLLVAYQPLSACFLNLQLPKDFRNLQGKLPSFFRKNNQQGETPQKRFQVFSPTTSVPLGRGRGQNSQSARYLTHVILRRFATCTHRTQPALHPCVPSSVCPITRQASPQGG